MLSLQGQGGAYDNIPRQPDNDLSARVAVSQNLYSGGANQARSRQGKLGVKQAEQSLADMKETVAPTCTPLPARSSWPSTREAS